MSREAEVIRRRLLGLKPDGDVFERCRHSTSTSVCGFLTTEEGAVVRGCSLCRDAAEDVGGDPNIDGDDLRP